MIFKRPMSKKRREGEEKIRNPALDFHQVNCLGRAEHLPNFVPSKICRFFYCLVLILFKEIEARNARLYGEYIRENSKRNVNI